MDALHFRHTDGETVSCLPSKQAAWVRLPLSVLVWICCGYVHVAVNGSRLGTTPSRTICFVAPYLSQVFSRDDRYGRM